MHIWQLAPRNYFLLILHIVVEGRGGRVIAWGDQSAHSENMSGNRVDGGWGQ